MNLLRLQENAAAELHFATIWINKNALSIPRLLLIGILVPKK